MLSRVDVVIAVPARDEERRLDSCLSSIGTAVRRASQTRQIRRAQVVVGAHLCRDATGATASTLLTRRPDLNGLVHVDDASAAVGGVRRGMVEAALATWPYDRRRTWIFSTDADSSVPVDWITSTLHQASERGAAAVVGLVRLDGWVGDNVARQAYEKILEAGMRPDGHDHVYGANLTVRLDAYEAVGGFEPVPHGEDHALVGRLRHAGWPVLTSFEPVVVTAGRMPGRAANGLGGLLLSLTSRSSESAVT